MSKDRLRIAGGTDATSPPEPPNWPLRPEWEALAARVAALRPVAVTVLLEGAQVEGERRWMFLTAPDLQGLTIGHAQVMQDLGLQLRPD